MDYVLDSSCFKDQKSKAAILLVGFNEAPLKGLVPSLSKETLEEVPACPPVTCRGAGHGVCFPWWWEGVEFQGHWHWPEASMSVGKASDPVATLPPCVFAFRATPSLFSGRKSWQRRSWRPSGCYVGPPSSLTNPARPSWSSQSHPSATGTATASDTLVGEGPRRWHLLQEVHTGCSALEVQPWGEVWGWEVQWCASRLLRGWGPGTLRGICRNGDHPQAWGMPPPFLGASCHDCICPHSKLLKKWSSRSLPHTSFGDRWTQNLKQFLLITSLFTSDVKHIWDLSKWDWTVWRVG